MKRRESEGFTRLGDSLGDALPAVRGMSEDGDDVVRPGLPPDRLLVVVWPEVVGAEIAANTRPVQLKQKRLVVATSSSVWAQTLQFMSATIIAGLNDRFGREIVQQLVFRHAGWEQRKGRSPAPEKANPAAPRPCTSVGPRAGLHQDTQLRSPGGSAEVTRVSDRTFSEEEEVALAEVEKLGLAPELRDRIVRAMQAAFVRGQQDSVR